MEKIIKGLENYSIDEQGIVRNIVKGTIKSVRPNKQTGYLQVDLWKITWVIRDIFTDL